MILFFIIYLPFLFKIKKNYNYLDLNRRTICANMVMTLDNFFCGISQGHSSEERISEPFESIEFECFYTISYKLFAFFGTLSIQRPEP